MYLKKTSMGYAVWRFSILLGIAIFRLATNRASAAGKPTDDQAKGVTALVPNSGRIVVDVQGVSTPTPLFFSATAEQTIQVGLAEILGEAKVKVHVLQGHPEVVTLGLSGEGEVIGVSGKGLRDWSVRQGAGKRFLDLRPLLTAGSPDPQDLDLVVQTRLKKPTVPGAVSIMMLTAGEAAGYSSKVMLRSDATIDLRVTAATGLVPLDDGDGVRGRNASFLADFLPESGIQPTNQCAVGS